MILLLSGLKTFWWLIGAHALTDYALQSDFIATYKDPKMWDEKRNKVGPWWWCMGAHAMINGGGVALVTGNIYLGIAESVVHFLFDTAKCLGILDVYQDQYLHIASKLCWAAISVL